MFNALRKGVPQRFELIGIALLTCSKGFDLLKLGFECRDLIADFVIVDFGCAVAFIRFGDTSVEVVFLICVFLLLLGDVIAIGQSGHSTDRCPDQCPFFRVACRGTHNCPTRRQYAAPEPAALCAVWMLSTYLHIPEQDRRQRNEMVRIFIVLSVIGLKVVKNRKGDWLSEVREDSRM